MVNIRLTEEEKAQLKELHKTSLNLVVRRRSLCLLLSNQGHSMVAISKLLEIDKQTVRRLFRKWNSSSNEDKLSAMYSAKGQGAKVKLSPVADILPKLIEQHNRNLKPILEILEKEHSIKVCKLTLQSFLKGAGL